MTPALLLPARLLVLVAAALLAVTGLVLVPAGGADAATSPVLTGGRELRGGQSVSAGEYRLIMQTDGNLVLYAAGGRVRWHSWTFGNPGARAVAQGDGNLVVYAASGRPLWNSGTHGNAGARTVVQTDGNLVVYRKDNVPLWHIGADSRIRTVDPAGLYAIRGGVAHAPCGDPGALAVAMATSGSLWHGGTGWGGQIVAVGSDAPQLVRAWQGSPPHVSVAGSSWSRMWAGAATGTDGRMYGVVNFCH